MTWHMQTGNRVLTPAEAALLKEAICAMANDLRNEADGDDQWPSGVKAYDELSWPQRLRLLGDVLDALLNPDVPMPALNAVTEGAVAAIFENVRHCFHFEFERSDVPPPNEDVDDKHYHWSRLILACTDRPVDANGHAIPSDYDPEPLDLYCDDPDRWDTEIDVLRDRILWDEDYDMDEIADMPPEVARRIKASLGIENDFFIETAPEPRGNEIEGLWERLDRLCH